MTTVDVRLGDALELFKGIADQSVDLIIADPPEQFRKGLWQ